VNKIVAIALVLIALLCSGVFYYFFWQQPQSHQKVISTIAIMDVTKGYQLKPEFVSINDLKWLSIAPLDVDFRTGNTYSQSLWVWKNPAGDVDYAATVWGPDETGNGYYVELARLCGRKMKIVCSEGTITFDEVTDWLNPKQAGYTFLQIVM